MNGLRYQAAVRASHNSAAFQINGRMFQPVVHHVSGIMAFDALRYGMEIDWLLSWIVGNSYAAPEVDKVDGDAGFQGNIRQQLKKEGGGFHEISGIEFVGCHHCVDAEMPNALVPGCRVGLYHLLTGKAILGLFRCSNDAISLFRRTGVEAEGKCVREADLFEIIQVGEVVQIDDAAKFLGFAVLLEGGVVGCEKQLVSGDADSLRKNKLRH